MFVWCGDLLLGHRSPWVLEPWPACPLLQALRCPFASTGSGLYDKASFLSCSLLIATFLLNTGTCFEKQGSILTLGSFLFLTIAFQLTPTPFFIL